MDLDQLVHDAGLQEALLLVSALFLTCVFFVATFIVLILAMELFFFVLELIFTVVEVIVFMPIQLGWTALCKYIKSR